MGGMWWRLLVLALCVATLAAGRVQRRSPTQASLGPDYASRRIIRDVEADAESAANDARAAAEAADMRFIETHAGATAAAGRVHGGAREQPESEDEATTGTIKAKIMMQAESLGISNANDYSESAVQKAVDQQVVRVAVWARRGWAGVCDGGVCCPPAPRSRTCPSASPPPRIPPCHSHLYSLLLLPAGAFFPRGCGCRRSHPAPTSATRRFTGRRSSWPACSVV